MSDSDETAPASDPDAAEATDESGSGLSSGGVTVSLTAVIAGLFLLLRVFAVSNWDWSTAMGVLGTVDFGNIISIVFGTLLGAPVITAVFLAWLMPVTLINTLKPLHLRSRERFIHALLFVAFAITAVVLLRSHAWWWMLIISAVVGVALMVGRVMLRWPTGRRLVHGALRHTLVTALCAAFVLAAFVRTPWTPHEHITTTHGVVDGYVLAVEPGYLQVLTAEDHELVAVVTADVKARDTVE